MLKKEMKRTYYIVARPLRNAGKILTMSYLRVALGLSPKVSLNTWEK